MGINISVMSMIGAVVANVVLGFLWYGPLFGKPWMKMMGFDAQSMDKSKQKGMGKTYAIMIVGSFVTVYVLAFSLVFAEAYLHVTGWQAGLQAGFWNWLGFMAPVHMGDQLWGGKPWKLFLITACYSLVSLMLSGVILAVWG